MMLKKERMKMKKRYVCRWVACPNCFGTGLEPGYGKCIVCHGTGKIEVKK